MCKSLNKKGKVCGNEPTKEFCHIHKPKVDLEALEVLNQLRSDNNRLKATCELLMTESNDLSLKLKNLTKGKVPKVDPVRTLRRSPNFQAQKKIDQLQQEVDKLKAKLAEVTKLNSQMLEDYNHYQIIKTYEDLHQKLGRVEFSRRGKLYHDLRLIRNQVAHPTI